MRVIWYSHHSVASYCWTWRAEDLCVSAKKEEGVERFCSAEGGHTFHDAPWLTTGLGGQTQSLTASLVQSSPWSLKPWHTAATLNVTALTFLSIAGALVTCSLGREESWMSSGSVVPGRAPVESNQAALDLVTQPGQGDSSQTTGFWVRVSHWKLTNRPGNRSFPTSGV